MADVNRDVVVVGSGFGGLVAGALLSRYGMKVCVLERHTKAGGFASAFRRKGFTFEVAVHLIEGKSQWNIRDKIFDLLQLWDVELVPVPHLCRFIFPEEYYEVPFGLEAAEQYFILKFPDERKAIAQFFFEMKKTAEEFSQFQQSTKMISFDHAFFNAYYPYLSKNIRLSIGQYLAQNFKSEKLRLLMMSNIGFFNDSPMSYPFAAYLINQAFYFDGKGYYFKNGSQSASNHLVKFITDRGGEVILGAEVVETEIKGSHVQSVIYKKNGKKGVVDCKNVIFNCCPQEANRILKRMPIMTSYEVGTSALMLYAGFKKGTEFLDQLSYFNFYADLNRKSSNALAISAMEMSLTNYSVLGESFRQKPTVDIILLDKSQQWFAPDKYDDFKIQIQQSILNRMNELIPSFTQNMELFELATPRTIYNYTRNESGAIYGYQPDSVGLGESLRRRWLYHEPRDAQYSNCYYSSAWSSSHGITGVTVGAFQAAQSLIKLDGGRLELN